MFGSPTNIFRVILRGGIIAILQILEKDPSGIVDILENLGITDTMPVVIYDDTFGALAAV